MARVRRYAVTDPAIVGESVDGESLVVNLRTGHYYSMRGAGDIAWLGVASGTTLDGLVARVAAVYYGDRAAIRDALAAHLEYLVAEGLVTVDEIDAEPQPDGEPSGAVPFEPPKVEKYTDMEELVLLDPIHEVDEAGWPRRPGHPA
jgi:hypothetical protein